MAWIRSGVIREFMVFSMPIGKLFTFALLYCTCSISSEACLRTDLAESF